MREFPEAIDLARRIGEAALLVQAYHFAGVSTVLVGAFRTARDWLQRNYDDEAVSRVLSWSNWGTDREAAVFEADAPEAVEFFKGAPHEPPRPPVTLSELVAAEQRMGCRLPELLKRLYTGVGNGGFGPQHGILAIAPGKASIATGSQRHMARQPWRVSAATPASAASSGTDSFIVG